MVGPDGRVYAFEPDEMTFEYLLRNIELHKLKNVIPVKKALAGKTGTALFSMDGSQVAGLAGFTQCANKQQMREVETVSFEDACREYGVPALIKMDIEGAEAEVVSTSAEFLKDHPIHLAIETEHRLNGEFTSVPVTRVLSSIGYTVWSSRSTGTQFTWEARLYLNSGGSN